MLVDTFMFYNELDVLEMRLRNLDPYVDLFVLVESEETHSGNPKPLYFDKERFAQWLPKIRHVVSKKLETSNPWVREKYQRSCILDALSDIPDDATIMLSDVDEIPDMTKLKDLDPQSTYGVRMVMFEYSFDYIFVDEPWVGTVITGAKNFKRAGPNFFRDNRWLFTIVVGGWHCSSFGDAEHVWQKITNYAHSKDDKHQKQTIDQIVEYVNKGIHADGSSKLIPRPDYITLPL